MVDMSKAFRRMCFLDGVEPSTVLLAIVGYAEYVLQFDPGKCENTL